MSVQSMPACLALNSVENDGQTGEPLSDEAQAHYMTQQRQTTLTNAIANGVVGQGLRNSSDQQPARHTKSAQKGAMLMMSPYGSKSTQRGGKDQPRNQRMQTMTAQKMQSTNLLSSNMKQSSTKNKFELPLLSNRSSSKPSLVQQKHPLSITKEMKSAQAVGVTLV